MVIGFDNKVLAGAWLPGQSENILRVTDLAKRLNIPLVWLVNCSGVKLTEQEKFYANRRGGGTTFFRHAELEPGRHSDPGRHLRHQPGRRRLPGHQPHGPVRPQGLQHRRGRRRHRQRHVPQGVLRRGGAEELIDAAKQFKAKPPGSVEIHYDETGFFRYVYEGRDQSSTASKTT